LADVLENLKNPFADGFRCVLDSIEETVVFVLIGYPENEYGYVPPAAKGDPSPLLPQPDAEEPRYRP
jgi:hypothetical protein